MKSFFKFSGAIYIAFLFVAPSFAQTNYKWKTARSAGYEYQYVENDPSNARFYTLKNGLTVILSPSYKKPRIQVYIAVKAGSKTDPSTHTGLAHYLEHMLFKGTEKFGSLDWTKEKPLLDNIQALYEQYDSTTDDTKRKEIYKQIDSISGVAAKYAIANEYDKMMAAMGATGTNAFTSFEQTVYTEDIPSNAIDRFLAVQAERFRDPVFRLFHTELEAVYEEKNRSLDDDGNKTFEEMFRLLFPDNNYGRQTTIGTIHDLKNPSLVEIRKYYNTYYVPNNMGIVMAGDFNPDEVIGKIDKAFSYMKPKAIPPYVVEPEKPIRQPVTAEVYGPEPANIMVGYRFPGAATDDAQILNLVGDMLTNGSAGLIDLDLVKKQKLLNASAFSYALKDYSVLMLMGTPAAGQDLEEVRSLLTEEIHKLKTGDFPDDLITSIINNEKKSVLQTNVSYNARAGQLMSEFTSGVDWIKHVAYINRLNSLTKQDIVNFANKYLNDNYVVVYKRQGEDKNTIKVDKPVITPVSLNREAQSGFLQKINNMPEQEIKPVWVDYKKDITHASAGRYPVLAIVNKDNHLFSLNYYYKTGSWNSRLLPLAAGYLEFLGTKTISAEAISKEFYKLASSFSINVSSENTYISLSGLQENFEQTVALFDDLLKNCVADQEALQAYISRLKKSRSDAKHDKYQIMRGLISYAQYGRSNPFNNKLSDQQLDSLKAEDLVNVLHDLAGYQHELLYYGPMSARDIATTLSRVHPAPETFTPLPETVRFTQQQPDRSEVLLAHYDMVQVEVYWVRNNDYYDASLEPAVSFFNQYFGGGMESVVFQTLRESKALAYSTFAFFSEPSDKNYRNTFLAYIGAQSDKFREAVDGMNELLTTLPESAKAVENSKESLMKKIASQRITDNSILFDYINAKKMGRDDDIRKTIYEKIQGMNFADLKKFFDREISGKPYTYCIVAGENKLDEDKLKSLGEVRLLDLKDVFGY